ncbi:MAG TPA: polymer-forming cytoskeletal protein [Candidatus Baltobacteraceae bacterium]|jgi:hypothetical protein|nr:polymer-forming cytoskeletal protein [Candidatus Baltobacteraceae bacterium]
MKYLVVIVALAACVFLGMRGHAAASSPQTIDHGGTYFNGVVVRPDQEVEGDVTVFNGDADIYGTVDGDVTTYGGTVIKEPGSVITGQTNEYASQWSNAVPWLPSAGAASMARESAKMMTLLAYSVIVVLVFLIFPVRVRTALDRVEHHPGLSAAVGALALVAAVPIAVLLFISFIGWPLLPLEVVAYIAGVLIGQAALGVLIGRRLLELVHPHNTPTPLMALVVGLVIICAAELMPVVGWMVTALVWLVGLGAAILAFIRETTFMGPGGAPGGTVSGGGPRPTISGPPMATP